MLILGIETSCDETAISVMESERGNLKLLSNVISSQTALHAKWGGVVPSLAAREHLKNIFPVLEMSLKKAEVTMAQISLIAVTNGPGLIPALLIGTNVAKTLSYIFRKPLIGIHHIEGHIYANFIGKNPEHKIQTLKKTKIKFPILCLVVSGGHTQLILMKKHLDYKIVGETLDDAAGEAFDKVARILNLGYPGGPIISKLAKNYKPGAENYFMKLPRPMINSKDFNFSFSGLKTAVLYTVKKHPNILKNVGMSSALCYEFQQAVIDVLIAKTLKATQKYKPNTIMLAGGVSANQELRLQLGEAIKNNFPAVDYRLPITDYSVDNAAMIAAATHFRWKKMNANERKKAMYNWKNIKTDAGLKL